MKQVEACLRRYRVNSDSYTIYDLYCKNMDKSVATLVDVYWHGDKTVLPLLLRLTFLSNFYSTALIADPDTFLTAVSDLPPEHQRAVAQSIAGMMFGVTRARFEAIRATLQAVPQSSLNYALAQTFLHTLENENAALLTNYFPPRTFAGNAAEFEVHWFSRDLHLLSETPLWPPASPPTAVYRITVLPAFRAPESATLNVIPSGAPQVAFHTLLGPRSTQLNMDTHAITAQQLAHFTVTLARSGFWQMPTEVPNGGEDGAEYILEGVKDGAYRIVVRWCPGATHQQPFAAVAQELFDLSGHGLKDGC